MGVEAMTWAAYLFVTLLMLAFMRWIYPPIPISHALVIIVLGCLMAKAIQAFCDWNDNHEPPPL